MSVEQTYLERTFLVESGDARIRLQNDLLQFDRYGASDPLPPGCRVGDFKTIAKDMQIGIGDVRVLPGDMIFARAHRADAPVQPPHGGMIEKQRLDENLEQVHEGG